MQQERMLGKVQRLATPHIIPATEGIEEPGQGRDNTRSRRRFHRKEGSQVFVDFFIRRPVFSTVCALLIILAGAICIPTLPVEMYPNLAPPVVSVTASYVGADAQTVEKAVTIPLEEAINGVEGMRYISSSITNSGVSSINISFQNGYDLSIA